METGSPARGRDAGVTRVEARTQVQRRDEAERRILDAAVAIAAEGGLEAITLADAGVRAGYSRGLPTHYFRSKNELVSALGVYTIDSFMARRRASHGNIPGFEGFLASIEFYFEAPLESPDIVRAFHAVLAGALSNRAIASAVAKLNRESVADIASAIRAGIQAKALRPDIDPAVEGVLILAGLRGVVAQWLVDPDAIDLKRTGTGFIAALKQRLAK